MVAVTGAVGVVLGAVVVVGDAVVVDMVVLVVASSFTCTGLVDLSDEHAGAGEGGAADLFLFMHQRHDSPEPRRITAERTSPCS